MKQIMIVMRYTFKDAVNKKAFKISTVIILLVILLLCALPRIISSFEEDDSPAIGETGSDSQGTQGEGDGSGQQGEADKLEKYYYIDDSGLIPGGADALAAAFPHADIVKGSGAELSQYEEEIRNDESVSAIIIKSAIIKSTQNGAAQGTDAPPDAGEQSQAGVAVPQIEFVTKSFMNGIETDTAAAVLTNAYVSDILQSAGVDSAMIELTRLELPYTSRAAGDMNISGYVMGILVTILTFFAIYYYGYGVSMSIATEKTSRVMETLVVSAKPSNILIGKCIGMGLLGLSQFAGVLISGVIFYNLLVPDGFTLMGMPLSFDAFTPASAVLMCIYFLLGYALYSVMNAVCGASVSKIEDLNSAMMPVMLVALISFYVGYFSVLSGAATGTVFQKIASYVPFCSPFVLPFRLLNEDVPASDIAISLILLIAAIAVIAAISIRIYSASVLHYGKRLKLKDYIRSRV